MQNCMEITIFATKRDIDSEKGQFLLKQTKIMKQLNYFKNMFEQMELLKIAKIQMQL